MSKVLLARREELLEGLEIVSKATSSNNIMPILSTVLLEVSSESCNLTCTNLATTITTNINIVEGENFAAAIPIAVLQKLLKLISDDNVKLLYDEVGMKLKLSSEKSKNTISCFSSDEFPKHDENFYQHSFWLKPTDLQTVGELITFAVSSESHQQVLQGVLMESDGESLAFISADGVRSSMYATSGAGITSKTNFRVIIPSEPLDDFSKLLTSGKIGVKVSKSHIEFHSGKTTATLSLINGNFPKVREAIAGMTERGNGQEIEMNTGEFLGACKMSNVFASEGANRLRVEFGAMFSNVSGYANQTGNSKNMFSMNTARDVSFNVNAKMFIEVLSKIKAEEFTMNVAGSTDAVVFSAVDFDFHHMIMPTT